MSFEDAVREVPRHFAKDENLIFSHFMAVLTSGFPDGEDFFVRSVRRFRDQVTDPALKRQVAGFIGQESVHGREHRVVDDRLATLGYGVKRSERITRIFTNLLTRAAPPKACLAQTAAAEHGTSTLAYIILTDEDMQTWLGPEMSTILLWHALEECEHKAVAFDVYKAAGGSERTRIRWAKLLRIFALVVLPFGVGVSLLSDRATYRRGNLRRSLRELRNCSLFKREVWEQLKEYERPGFHPNDRDDTELIERWRVELFGEEGTLNQYVLKAAV